MFPSSSFGVDPFPYLDLSPNSTPRQQQLIPPLFSHFPAYPFLDNEFFLDHLISPSQSLLLPSDTQAMTAVSTPSNDKQNQSMIRDINVEPDTKTLKKRNATGNGEKKENPKRRGSKTDRHSKICTRQGPRDRRMRLSLKIARRFFDLQDLLGFDKASKTIDWLFNHSKAAIKEVAGNFDTALEGGPPEQNLITSSFRCKTVSESSRAAATYSTNLEQENVFGRNNNDELLMLVNNSSDPSNRKADELGLQHAAKDSRTRARARARERTKERMLFRSLESSKQDSSVKTNHNCSVQVGPVMEDDMGTTSCSQVRDEVMDKTSTSGLLTMLNNSLEIIACSRGQLGNINPFDCFGHWNVDLTRICPNDGAMSRGSFTGITSENPSSHLLPHSSLPTPFQGN